MAGGLLPFESLFAPQLDSQFFVNQITPPWAQHKEIKAENKNCKLPSQYNFKSLLDWIYFSW